MAFMKYYQLNRMETHPNLPFYLGFIVMLIKGLFFDAAIVVCSISGATAQFGDKMISVVFWGIITGIVSKAVGRLWDSYWRVVWHYICKPFILIRTFFQNKPIRRKKK